MPAEYQRMYCDIAMQGGGKKKTAILVRCTQEEAELIRRAAASERRTLSGYVLNALMNRIRTREALPGWPASARKRDDD